MTVRLSVVIPVKDDASNLRTCLAALSKQHNHIAEVIVVDNGSSDDSIDVATAFGATVLRESTPGIAAAASKGYDAARGDVIGRLDADSIPFPDWALEVVTYFDSHPSISAISGGAVFTDGPRILRSVGAALYLGAYFVAVAAALAHWPMFGSNCAFRAKDWREVVRDVHRSDLLVHDDMDLSYHLGPARRIRLSTRMRVGISARPFSDGKSRLRIRRGFHTIAVHCPSDLPWLRAWRRLASRWQTHELHMS